MNEIFILANYSVEFQLFSIIINRNRKQIVQNTDLLILYLPIRLIPISAHLISSSMINHQI